jgi:hypothetical protein
MDSTLKSRKSMKAFTMWQPRTYSTVKTLQCPSTQHPTGSEVASGSYEVVTLYYVQLT